MADLPHLADRAHARLIDHMQKLVGPADGNRQALLMLVRLATTPEKARMVSEALAAEDFLDEDRSRAGRYAWDTTLHAVRNWAILAQRSPDADQRADDQESRDERAIAIALDSEISYWLNISRDRLAGRDRDVASDRQAQLELELPGLRERVAMFTADDDRAFAVELLDRVELALTGAEEPAADPATA